MIITTPVLQTVGEIIRVESTIVTRGQSDTVWAELSARYVDFIAPDATAFASPFIFPASRRGEKVTIDGSVSPQWLSGVEKILARIVSWQHGFKPVSVSVGQTSKDTGSFENVGVFFSGGVDSFTTYLKDQRSLKPRISHFIFVHGYDIALENIILAQEVQQSLALIAKETGIPCIQIRTNVREVTDKLLGWEMAHGGALAMIALLLRRGFSTIIIPGGGATDQAEPWGSSEYLDPLWSTETVTIEHDLDTLMRFEKVRDYIAHSDVALAHLRVCWRNKAFNCCQCDKCLMTMVELRIAGVLDKAKTFPVPLDLSKIRTMYTSRFTIMQYVEQAYEYLKQTGQDQKLCEALAASLAYSNNPGVKKRLINMIHDLDWKYNESRLFVWLSKRKK